MTFKLMTLLGLTCLFGPVWADVSTTENGGNRALTGNVSAPCLSIAMPGKCD